MTPEQVHKDLHESVEDAIIDILDDAFTDTACGASALAALLCMYLRDVETDPEHAADIVMACIEAASQGAGGLHVMQPMGSA